MRFFGYEIYPLQLLCFFGWHDWTPWHAPLGKRYPVFRKCRRCGEYDIAKQDELRG